LPSTILTYGHLATIESNQLFKLILKVLKEGRWEFGRDKTVDCGTPWAQPISITLIRDTTYKNRRELIAIGSYVEPNGQQKRCSKREPPIRSETNRMSSTTNLTVELVVYFPRREQLVHFSHHGEGVGHVEHVGFAAAQPQFGSRLMARRFVDETPADRVRSSP